MGAAPRQANLQNVGRIEAMLSLYGHMQHHLINVASTLNHADPLNPEAEGVSAHLKGMFDAVRLHLEYNTYSTRKVMCIGFLMPDGTDNAAAPLHF